MSDCVERVRRMLALAASAGTAAEAETAGRLARGEMRRFGVTARDVARAEAEIAAVAVEVETPDEAWRRQLAFLAASRRGCKVYVVPARASARTWVKRVGVYRFVGAARSARRAVADFRRMVVEVDHAAARAATKHVWASREARVVWFDAFRERAQQLITAAEVSGKRESGHAPVQDAAPPVDAGFFFEGHVGALTEWWRREGSPSLSAEEAAAQVIESARSRAERVRWSLDGHREVPRLAARSHLGWAELVEVADKFLRPVLREVPRLAARSHLGWADEAHFAAALAEREARLSRRHIVVDEVAGDARAVAALVDRRVLDVE